MQRIIDLSKASMHTYINYVLKEPLLCILKQTLNTGVFEYLHIYNTIRLKVEF